MSQLSQFQILFLILAAGAVVGGVIAAYVFKLKKTIERQSRNLGHILKENKTLKDAIVSHQAYAGNDFTTFDGYPRDTLHERCADRTTFVLIRRSELHDVVVDAFEKGHGVNVALKAELQSVMRDLDETASAPKTPTGGSSDKKTPGHFRLLRPAQMAG